MYSSNDMHTFLILRVSTPPDLLHLEYVSGSFYLTKLQDKMPKHYILAVWGIVFIYDVLCSPPSFLALSPVVMAARLHPTIADVHARIEAPGKLQANYDPNCSSIPSHMLSFPVYVSIGPLH